MSRTFTAAVIGCGGAGRNHASGYERIEDVTLVGVCDINEQAARELGERFDVPAYTDISRLLDEHDPEFVSVATSEPYHVEPTVTALEAGANVLCEKIMAHSLSAGQEMLNAESRSDGVLGIDYNYRHMPTFASLEEQLAAGNLGEIHLATADAHAFGWHHTLDMLRFLLGSAETVRATIRHDPSIVSNRFRFDELLYVPSHAVTATFEFDSGACANVSSSIHSSLDEHLIDLAVYGSDGRARITGMTPGDTRGEIAPGPVAEALRNTESIDLDESFRRSIAAFVDAVRVGDRPPTTGDDGMAVMELEHAVLKAAREGGVIEL